MPSAKKMVLPLALCFCGALLLFGLQPWLLQTYISSAPRAPNPATGQVIEFNQHGYVIFFSRQQELVLASIALSGALLILAGGIALRDRDLARDRQ